MAPESGRKLLLATLLASALAACAHGPTLGRATDIQITGTGGDAGAHALDCSTFQLSPRQVQTFLDHARILTQRELHDHYDHLPCYVEGTARFAGYPATWKIRAGGTGSLLLMGGEYLPIADPNERYLPD